jgi:hypothetical protein
VVDQLVVIGVAPDLVPAIRDLSHQLRVALGNHPDDEKRRPHAGDVEEVEQAVRIGDDMRRRWGRSAGDAPTE